jgi:hypothetical protein
MFRKLFCDSFTNYKDSFCDLSISSLISAQFSRSMYISRPLTSLTALLEAEWKLSR